MILRIIGQIFSIIKPLTVIIGCLCIFPYLSPPHVHPLNATSNKITHQTARPVSPKGIVNIQLTTREV